MIWIEASLNQIALCSPGNSSKEPCYTAGILTAVFGGDFSESSQKRSTHFVAGRSTGPMQPSAVAPLPPRRGGFPLYFVPTMAHDTSLAVKRTPDRVRFTAKLGRLHEMN